MGKSQGIRHLTAEREAAFPRLARPKYEVTWAHAGSDRQYALCHAKWKESLGLLLLRLLRTIGIKNSVPGGGLKKAFDFGQEAALAQGRTWYIRRPKNSRTWWNTCGPCRAKRNGWSSSTTTPSAQETGEYVSALSNGAALHRQGQAFMLWL
jgi:hypothetical protein